MAEFVQLVVQVDKSQLQSLQADVSKLNGTTLDIKVDNSKLSQAAGNVKRIAETFNEGQLVKSVKDVNIQFGETARIITKIGQDGVTTTKTLTRDLEAQRKVVQGAAQAYEKYRLEIEKTKEPTALQKQIDAITGVSTEFKSAKDSADFFRMRGLTPLEQELDDMAKSAETAAKKTESLWDNFQKFARWYLVGNVIVNIKRSLDDALETMRAVDDELVTIRKVTGFDDAQINKIKEQAYEVASAYGEAADAYLESVAAFSRAGYKEQSAALAELATKTQIVGDTTADIANQFLLSVDAAYHYKGSIEDLTAVLDGANEIDNKYATSIEKIAQGLGVVAPVASQMHVGINELTAAIGTITAVTQRSGNEAARALRALFLNIVGDTKTEIEEGVTWTTGEIEGLKDVIKQYAPEAYKAAEATQSIIDPMEAIGGLAKSMQDGLLTEQKLMEMVSDIGGKLRTSQLLALIQNWDMYQSMLVDYGNALGSADKEVENALNSWTRKTNQLKNAWAEFISHLISSDGIKAGIDLLTEFVQVLDSGVGGAVAFAGAGAAIYKVFTMIATTAPIKAVAEAIELLVTHTASLSEAIGLLTTTMMANPLFWAASAGAAIYLAIKAAKELTYTYEDQAKELKDLEEQYEKAYGHGSELDELRSKTEALTGEERKRLKVLEDEASAMEKQIEMAKRIAVQNWESQQYGVVYGAGVGATGEYRSGRDKTAEQVKEVAEAFHELRKEYAQGEQDAEAYNEQIRNLKDSLEESAEALRLKKEVGLELSDTERALLSLYDQLKEKLVVVSQETDQATASMDTFTRAMDEMERMGYITDETMQALIAEFPDLQDGLIQTENGWLLNKDAIEKHYNALLADYQLVFDNAKSAALTLIEAETGKQMGINATTQAIKNQLAALALLYETKYYERRINESGGLDTFSEIQRSYNSGTSSEYQAATKARQAYQAISTADANLSKAKGVLSSLGGGGSVKTGGSGGGGSSGSRGRSGGGSGSSSSAAAEKEVDTELERIQTDLSYAKQMLSFLEASNASEVDRAVQMMKIQDLLHEEANHLRDIKASKEDVLKVSTEWWSYENKINKLFEDDKDLLKEIEQSINDARDATIALLDAEEAEVVGPLQEKLDALKAQRDALKDSREEEEKILAVEEARIALENAQKERNIRQYNAATGQWEWVANEQTVASARDRLSDAEKALADYYSDQEIALLQGQIDKIQSDYESARAQAKSDAEAQIEDAKNAYSSGKTIGQYKQDYAEAKARGDAAGMEAANAGANAIRERLGLDTQSAYADIAAVRARTYDSGGILRGIGGIKATREDEMILSPAYTSALLSAEKNGAFNALLDHLGIVTAAAQSFAGYGSTVSSKYGNQHNGDVFYFNGIELTNVTENTSLGDFVRKVKTLSIYSGG